MLGLSMQSEIRLNSFLRSPTAQLGAQIKEMTPTVEEMESQSQVATCRERSHECFRDGVENFKFSLVAPAPRSQSLNHTDSHSVN